MNLILVLFGIFLEVSFSNAFGYTEIKANSIKEESIYAGSSETKFFYYTDISNYSFKEESIVTIYFNDKSDTDSKYHVEAKLKIFYGSKESLPSPGTISKSDFPLAAYSPDPKYLFYFFGKNSDVKESYLLIEVTVKPVEFESQFSIVVSAPHGEPFAMYSTSDYLEFEIKQSYVPIIKKYSLSREEDTSYTYTFLTTAPIITGFNKNVTEDPTNPGNSGRITTFTFGPHADGTTKKIFTIVVFGEKGTYSLFIDNVNSQFNTYSKQSRPRQRTLLVQMENSYEDYYLICEYRDSSLQQSIIYFEEIYGDIDIYYEDAFPETITSLQSILPGEGSGEHIVDKFIITIKNVDLINVKCKSVCFFNIHIMDIGLANKDTIGLGEMNLIYVQKDEPFEANISNRVSFTNFEIFNVNGKEGNVDWGKTSINLTPTTRYIRDKMTPDEESGEGPITKIKISTKLDEIVLFILRVTQSENDVFTEINKDAGGFKIGEKNVAFKLPNDKNCMSYHITIEAKNNPFDVTYQLQRGQINYLSLPDTFTLRGEKNKPVTLDIYNPFYAVPNFEEELRKDKDSVYAKFSFTKTPAEGNILMTARCTSTKFYRDLPLDTVQKIEDQETFYLNRQKEKTNKLILVTLKCKVTELDLYLKFNQKELLSKFIYDRLFDVYEVDPKQYRFELEFRSGNQSEPFPQAQFYYKFLSEEEVKEYKLAEENLTLRVVPTGEGKIDVTWEYPFEDRKKSREIEYEFYLLELGKLDINFSYCDIESKKIKPNKIFKTKERAIAHSLKFDTSKNYSVFVSATPAEGPIKKMFYTPVVIETKSIEVPRSSKAPYVITVLVLLFILSVIIFFWIKAKRKQNIILQESVMTSSYNPLNDASQS